MQSEVIIRHLNGISDAYLCPNPCFNEIFYIKDVPEEIELKVRIYDISGELVCFKVLTADSHGNIKINHSLATGVYFVVIESPSQRRILKLAVIR